MRNIQRVASGSLFQQLVSAGVFFALTRSLGANAYGIVATATALATSCFSFGSFWAGPYIVRSGVSQVTRYGRLGDTFVKGGSVFLAGAFIATLLTLLLARAQIIKIPIEPRLLLLLAFSPVLMALLRIGLQTIQNFRLYSYALWLDRSLTLVFILALIALSKVTITSAIIATGTTSLMVGAIGLAAFVWRHVDQSIRSFSLAEFFRASSPVFVSTALLYFSSGAFIIFSAASLFGSREAGWTSVAFVAAGLLTQPVNWVTPTLLPRFTRSFEAGASNDFKVYLDTVMVPVVSVYATLATIAMPLLPLAIPIALGHDFSGSAPIVGLVLAAYIAEIINLLVVQLLYARNQQKTLLFVSGAKGAALVLVLLTRASLTLEAFVLLVALGYWLGAAIELWVLRDLLSPKFVKYLTTIFLLSIASSAAVILLERPVAALVSSIAAIGLLALVWSQKKNIAQRLGQLSNGWVASDIGSATA